MRKELEARDIFISKVRPLMVSRGFNLVKHESGIDFHKTNSWGYQQIQILPSFYGGHSELGLTIYLRFNEINCITNKFYNVVESASETNPTFGVGLGFFGVQQELMVDTEQDIDRVTDMLVKLVEEKILPFFVIFSSVEAVDNEFNRENRPANLFLHDINDRPFVALTAAALTGNPNFFYWESYYRARLIKSLQHRKDRYEGLVKYLRDNVIKKR